MSDKENEEPNENELRVEIAFLKAEVAELTKQLAAVTKERDEHKKMNRVMWEDNVELSRKCKEHAENAKLHFDNAQKLMRFELKQPEQKRKPFIKTHDGRIVELE